MQPRDRIIGAIYGHAIGDAVGFTAEYHDAAHEITYPAEDILRGIEPGDWSAATDHMMLVARAITSEPHFDPQTVAAHIVSWALKGYPELGDTKGVGQCGAINMITARAGWTDDPITVARTIHGESNGTFSSNTSLMRTGIVGAIADVRLMEWWATHLSLITHTDPRCVAACIFYSAVLHTLIYRGVSAPADVDTLVRICVSVARAQVTDKAADDEFSHWVQAGYMGTLSDLKLGVRPTYVLRSLACGIYALQLIKASMVAGTRPSYKKLIKRIAAEGGSSSINCAVAGAILGAYVGRARIAWTDVPPHREWLDAQINQFILGQVDRVLPNVDGINTGTPSIWAQKWDAHRDQESSPALVELAMFIAAGDPLSRRLTSGRPT